jgi:hypothetical protein
VYTPEPSGVYSKNSALSGYTKPTSYFDYMGKESSKFDYTYAYYTGYDHGDVYIFGEDDFDSLYEMVDSFYDDYDWETDMDWDYYDSYYAGYDDYDWESDYYYEDMGDWDELDWDTDFYFEDGTWDDLDWDMDFDVEKCANEGEECICLGTVYYGLPTSFDDMIKEPHMIQDSQGSIQCNNDVFGDPIRG